MGMKEALLAEFQNESVSTRKVLERTPEKSFTWKPHEKSMSLGRLSQHLAEIPQWVEASLTKDELDFATMDYKQVDPASTAELLKFFDDNVNAAVEIIKNTPEEEFMKNWTMRNGDKVYMTIPKAAVVRGFVMSHLIHHRGQMTVYLRMLDVPLPGIYGPAADENTM